MAYLEADDDDDDDLQSYCEREAVNLLFSRKNRSTELTCTI
jgi:hypothetical protein